MAYLKWQKNFQCGNTAIGLFCSVFLLKQQNQNTEFYPGELSRKLEKMTEMHEVGRQCILNQI